MASNRPDLSHFIETTADRVASYLEKHIGKIEELYEWGGATNKNLKTCKAINGFDFDTLPSDFEKTIKLRELFEQHIQNCEDFEDRYETGSIFIRDWGGVRNQNDKDLKATLKKFDEMGDLLSIQEFKGISSWSKYLSIRRPKEAAIYDFRVAYSINAINLLNNETAFMFPMPNSRSSRLGLLCLESLFVQSNMMNAPNFVSRADLDLPKFAATIKKRFCISDKEAYSTYLKLLKQVVKKLEPNLPDVDILKIEMLLFALAPKNILYDVYEKCGMKA